MSTRLIKNAALFCFLSFLALLVFLTSSGPLDAYHEGAIFPPGVAVADGLTIYKEVNHQYGFLHIYINAFVFNLVGNQLFAYRLIGLAIALVNAFTLFLILRRFSSRSLAAVFSSSTLLISPAWSYTDSQTLGTIGPWPNIYGLTLTLISIYLLWRVTQERGNVFLIFLSALFSTLSIGSRIQFIAVVLFQTLLIIGLAFRHRVRFNVLLNWILGVAIGMSSLILTLWSQGILDDAFEQLLFVWTLETPNSPHLGPIDFLRSLALILFFAVVSYILWFFSRKRAKSLGFVVVLLGIFLLYALQNFTDFLSLFPADLARIMNHSLAQALFSIAVVFVTTFLVMTANDTIKLARKLPTGSLQSIDPFFLFLSATCFGMLFQFHNVNGPYLWMCIHPFIAWYVLRFNSSTNSGLFSHALSSARSYMVFAIMASMSLAAFKVDFERFSYSTPMLSGIYEYEQEKQVFVDENFSFLRSLDQFGKLRLDCSAGIYSVDERGYALDSKWTWNEIPFSWRKENIESSIPGHTLVVCNPDERWSGIYSELQTGGYLEFITSNNYLTAYRVIKLPKISSY